MVSLRAGQVLLLLVHTGYHSSICKPNSSCTHVRSFADGFFQEGQRKNSQVHGQRTIDSNRASEIQNALIRQKYLTGAPSGQWDAQTQVAMRQYQSDHGWQTKLMPDSRALISLGLGPNHTNDSPVGHSAPSVQAPNTQEASRLSRSRIILWPRFIPFRSSCYTGTIKEARATARASCVCEGPSIAMNRAANLMPATGSCRNSMAARRLHLAEVRSRLLPQTSLTPRSGRTSEAEALSLACQ